MTITKIEQQKNHPGRVNVFIDDRFGFAVYKATLLKAGIHTGDSVTNEILDQLMESEEKMLARQQALRFLARRLHSEKELKSKLREKEYTPEVIEETVKQMRSLNYLNDEAFAVAYLHDIRLKKIVSKNLLARNLRMKGVSKATVQDVIAKEIPEDDLSLALDSAKKEMKKFRFQPGQIDSRKKQWRIAQFLLRRGFSWSVIREALKLLFKNETEIDEEN